MPDAEPSAFVYDGARLIGLLFDERAGTVATTPERRPLGTFRNWRDGYLAVADEYERQRSATIGGGR